MLSGETWEFETCSKSELHTYATACAARAAGVLRRLGTLRKRCTTAAAAAATAAAAAAAARGGEGARALCAKSFGELLRHRGISQLLLVLLLDLRKQIRLLLLQRWAGLRRAAAAAAAAATTAAAAAAAATSARFGIGGLHLENQTLRRFLFARAPCRFLLLRAPCLREEAVWILVFGSCSLFYSTRVVLLPYCTRLAGSCSCDRRCCGRRFRFRFFRCFREVNPSRDEDQTARQLMPASWTLPCAFLDQSVIALLVHQGGTFGCAPPAPDGRRAVRKPIEANGTVASSWTSHFVLKFFN